MARTIRARSPLAAFCLLVTVSAAPALAQETPQAEQARLEKLLEKVDGALNKLRAVNDPPVTFTEYDLRALFRSAPDRSAPSLKLPTTDGGSQTAAGGGAGGGFSFESADEGSDLNPDYVEDLLQVGFLEGHKREMRFAGGFLHLKTTAANHAIARTILGKIRRQRLRCVQVEVGIYSLSPQLQEELERASLLSGGVLDAAALAKLDGAVARGEGKLADAALLSSLGQQSVYFHSGAERSYVSSFDRSSGGTGQIVETVSDPIVDTLRTGLALEVRPTVLEGGRKIMLDLHCARAQLKGMTRRTTPYGAIDVPRLELTSTRTSTRVPLGMGVLVSATRKAAAKPKEGQKPAKDTSILIVVRPR
jgi:hypothetical protein